jgi:hypothetical protein
MDRWKGSTWPSQGSNMCGGLDYDDLPVGTPFEGTLGAEDPQDLGGSGRVVADADYRNDGGVV